MIHSLERGMHRVDQDFGRSLGTALRVGIFAATVFAGLAGGFASTYAIASLGFSPLAVVSVGLGWGAIVAVAAFLSGSYEESNRLMLSDACDKGDLSAVRDLVERGYDPFSQVGEHSSFYRAAVKGHASIVEYLLPLVPAGIDIHLPDEEGYSALHSAVIAGHVEEVRLLLDDLIDRACRRKSPIPEGLFPSLLLSAVAKENGSVFRAILHRMPLGADVNPPDASGITPLHRAVSGDAIGIVISLCESILQKGANLHPLTRENGRSPLYLALDEGCQDIASYLIRITPANVNPNIPDVEGTTPLHIAAELGDLEIAEELVEHIRNIPGADINPPDHKGVTPAGLARKHGHVEIANLINPSTSESEEETNLNKNHER